MKTAPALVAMACLLGAPGAMALTIAPGDAGKGRTVATTGIHLVADERKSAMANVFWIFEATVKKGKVAELKKLVREMSDAASAKEPGTLIYEWTISADERTAQVHERYANSGAALKHLASFNKFYAERLMKLITPRKMTVYGKPSATLKRQLEGAGPVYMQVLGGFVR